MKDTLHCNNCDGDSLKQIKEISMKSLIFGIIGVIWGGFILISQFFRTQNPSAGAYGAGQMGGIILGGLLFIAGLWAIISYLKKRK